MTATRAERVRDLFQQALDLPETERIDFLREECGEDSELLAELLSLLEAHRGAETFLGPAAMAGAMSELADEVHIRKIIFGRGRVGRLFFCVFVLAH